MKLNSLSIAWDVLSYGWVGTDQYENYWQYVWEKKAGNAEHEVIDKDSLNILKQSL